MCSSDLVVLIDSHMDCDDCKGAVVENELYTWDGAWTTLTPALTEDWLTHLAELDDGTLVAAGTDVAEWYGDWTFEGVNGSFADVAAQGNAVLAVTDTGTVFRGLPGDLAEETVGTEPLVAVADAGGVAWALGTSNAWYDAGAGWTAVALPEGTWRGLSSSSEGVVVVGDDLGPVGLVGGASGFSEAWREVDVPVGPVWVDEEGNSWSGGSMRVARWGGLTEAWALGFDPWAMAGGSTEDVLALGYENVASWDGTAWTETSLPDVFWMAGAVASDGAAFIGGADQGDGEEQQAVVRQRSGTGWEDLDELPVTAMGVAAITAFTEDDVYVLTWSGSQLLHWDGADWEVLVEGAAGDPACMWGISGDDLYVGGEGLWHWDGAALSEVEGAPFGVTGLAGDEDGVLVAGTDGWGDAYAPVALLYEDGGWSEIVRADDRVFVGAGGGERVVLAGRDGLRE